MVWALFSYLVPIYPLYAVFFADTGLSGAEISLLFVIWSAVGIVAEVPSGALADRFSRRWSLVAASVLQAVGYVVWVTAPEFAGFAVGFVLWGLGGALISGAFEALLYDGLAAAGEQERFARVNGWVTATGLLSELPAAAAASWLFSVGGYVLAGWVSVGVCLVGAAVASLFPEPVRDESDEDELGYFATLRVGVREAAAHPGARAMVIAAAVLGGLDAFEEYFPLMAHGWGVSSGLVPLAMVGIPLAGAAGAAVGGVMRWRPGMPAWVLGAAMVLLLVSGLWRQPWGLALVAVFYGLYRAVLVVVEARLQDSIEGPARATVTSVAGIGVEVAAFGVYGAWALGGVVAVALLFLVVAVALPGLARGSARVVR